MSQESAEQIQDRVSSPEVAKTQYEISVENFFEQEEQQDCNNDDSKTTYIDFISNVTPVIERANINPHSQKIIEISSKINKARAYQLSRQFFVPVEKKQNAVLNIFSKVFDNSFQSRLEPLTEERLINDESAIGAEIFGPLEPGEYRAFFYEGYKDGFDSWIFHKNHKGSSVTFRYEIQSGGILRSSSTDSESGVQNYFIEGEELDRFMIATQMYHDKIMDQMYSMPQDDKDKIHLIHNNIDQSGDRLAA